jgi:hypothetical protein
LLRLPRLPHEGDPEDALVHPQHPRKGRSSGEAQIAPWEDLAFFFVARVFPPQRFYQINALSSGAKGAAATGVEGFAFQVGGLQ